uniref:Uncharacterized protein n=1 Tax=Timema bartmani TaxID=61472 RepID=A0A7R9HYM4_9NEOP|nr:unnamed protein product [Timema bartmani]
MMSAYTQFGYSYPSASQTFPSTADKPDENDDFYLVPIVFVAVPNKTGHKRTVFQVCVRNVCHQPLCIARLAD